LISTSDLLIISPDARIVWSSVQMKHGATSGKQQRAKICVNVKYLFGLADVPYVHFSFTPGEENNKSFSV